MPKIMTIKPNTIKDRGLKSVLEDYIATNNALNNMIDSCIGIEFVEVYKGAHSTALDTIAWFAYGIKPEVNN